MGERKVGKRIDSANVGPQLTALYQCAQLIKLAAVLSGENEVITRVLAPGLNDVLWLCNVHDRDHAAQLCEHVGATRQCVAADGVEHDIDAAATLADIVNTDESFIKTPAGKGFALVGPDINDPKYFGRGAGIAVRKGDSVNTARLNTAIDAIRANGKYQQVMAKYFAFDIYGE